MDPFLGLVNMSIMNFLCQFTHFPPKESINKYIPCSVHVSLLDMLHAIDKMGGNLIAHAIQPYTLVSQSTTTWLVRFYKGRAKGTS